MQENLITAEDLAQRLGLKADTIRRWASKGKIPSHRLSHKVVRFKLSEVLSSLEPRVPEAVAV